MAAILGLDVGTKTIGVASGDEEIGIAFPVTVIERRGLRRDLDQLREIAEDRDAHEAVVGLPLSMDGSQGDQAKHALEIANELEKRGFTVHLQDERLTTVSAERALLEADLSRKRRKQVIDKIAATLILQDFFDRRRAARDGGPA